MNLTIFDKNGDKVSLTETGNEVDEEKVTKENFASLLRYDKNSLQDENVENLDDIKNYKLLNQE